MIRNLLVAACLALMSRTLFAQSPTPLRTQLVTSGLSRPLLVTPAPGDNDRLFIVEQFSGSLGRVRIFKRSTRTLLPTPFLTVHVSTGGERGMLGLAFHPNYAANGYFYVNYTDPSGATIVRRFRVSLNPDVADAASGYTIMRIAQPFSNHNGGDMRFGPDGFLYIGVGDGGGSNDPQNNAQNLNVLLGKMLRIDVNSDAYPSNAAANYAIPPTNPYRGATPGRDEIWSRGLRNPWRWSFDRLTGALYIADVGQDSREEVNFEPAGTPGRNYGWRCMEGNLCTGLSGCACNGPSLTLPIHTYGHNSGCSITGGFVYRGSAIPDLRGTYFFGDFCSARIWSFRYSPAGGLTDFRERTAELDPPGPAAISSVSSFGEDNAGELYVCDLGGSVWKIVPACAPCGVPSVAPSLMHLRSAMDRYHKTLDVYTDADAAGNHFAVHARTGSAGVETFVPRMNDAWASHRAFGPTSIRCEFLGRGNDFGGWTFLNGALGGPGLCGVFSPRANWGTVPNAGLNLGAGTRPSTLSFYAAGAQGGEKVRFYCFGIGRDPQTGQANAPHPDSAPARFARDGQGGDIITLSPVSQGWTRYTIDLPGADLSYILAGFAWSTSAVLNGGRDIAFYIDHIQFDQPRTTERRLITSYHTFGPVTPFDRAAANVAWTYDNAVAILAFLAAGEVQRASMLADALQYALGYDRYYGSRLRNGYQGGDIALPPAWLPAFPPLCQPRAFTARLPGYTDRTLPNPSWVEDSAAVATHTGNVAWAMIALLAHDAVSGQPRYRETVLRMAGWVEAACRSQSGFGGYFGGFEGPDGASSRVGWKSTEHNLDLYVAFTRLSRLPGQAHWANSAAHARDFALRMWDARGRKFLTGTVASGNAEVRNTSAVPLDAQAWAVLALRDAAIPYLGALDFAESFHRVAPGLYDFNTDRDGAWYEGSAHMALALRASGQEERAAAAIAALRAARYTSGGLPAASRDGLTTGFSWAYYRRPHVGATAWQVLAELNANPYWIGEP